MNEFWPSFDTSRLICVGGQRDQWFIEQESHRAGFFYR
jgi:hypothetical protein